MKQIFVIFFFGLFFIIKAQKIQVYTDFPGGNIMVDSILGNIIYVRPDLRDTEGDWFYWSFGIKGECGQNYTVKFPSSKYIAACGPAVSSDGGNTWSWLWPCNNAYKQEFSVQFSQSDDYRFCISIPYTGKNFNQFYESKLAGLKNLYKDTLCLTKKNRPVEIFTLKPSKEIKYKFLFTARHHCCEMTASYVLEGLIEYLAKESNELIKSHIEIKFIPFMDIDGVEDGDQGKNRKPRDHNRDYNDSSIYCSTAMLRKIIPGWSQNKLVIALDLHCPGLQGWRAEQIYFYGSSDTLREADEKKLSAILQEIQQGELKFSADAFNKYGSPNNKGNDPKGWSFRRWVSALPGNRIGTTLEFPYAVVGNQSVTVDNARAFGRDLGRAIEVYLSKYIFAYP